LSLFDDAKLLIRNAQYRLWRWRNPEASFTEYFALIAEKDLARGRAHPTLGPNLTIGDPSESGRQTFDLLVSRYHIEPGDVCVEYGCGTLRVGRHAIAYLEPGHYWGLDISLSLLDGGLALIGADVAEQKMPALRVISQLSVAEAAAAKPKFLYSISVLMHVHPNELVEFMSNIVTIVGAQGLGIIAAQWTDTDTRQIGRQSWVHSFSALRAAVDASGGVGAFVERDVRSDRVSGVIELRRAPVE
jgi:SAM-dependent methyltransferase